MKYFIDVLKKYAVFTGRARRKEYWMFNLFYFIILVIAAILDNILGLTFSSLNLHYGVLYALTALVCMLPGLGVSVRRMHDINKSGWTVLISLIPLIGSIWLLVLLVKEGTKGPNKYGQDPKSDGPYVDVNNPDILDSNM